MKTILLLFVSIIHLSAIGQIPQTWCSRGVGGGGALFSPTINPSNPNEFYVACDMSELFHSTDFGLSYSNVNFREVVAFNPTKVWFTNVTGLLYCINNRTGVFQVSKSLDNGQTWDNVEGMMPWEEVYALFVDYHNPDILVTNFWSSILFSDDGGGNFITIHDTDIGQGAHLAGVFFDLPDIFIGLNEGLLVSHDSGNTFDFEEIPGMAEGQGFYSFTGAKQNDTIRLMGTTIEVSDFWNGMPATEWWEAVDDVYRLDYGISDWQSVGETINWGWDFPMLISMAENDIHTAYLGGSMAWEFPTILKTCNGGENWQHVFLTDNNQNITTGWAGYQGDHHWWYPGAVLGIDVARFNADTIIFSDMGVIHKSADGGQSWTQAYTSPQDQHPAGSPTPKNQDYHSIGIENTSVWCLNWHDEENMFAGFSDINGLRSEDGGESWGFDFSGHNQNTMYWMVKHPANENIYAATSTIHDIYQSHRLRDAEIEYPGSGGTVIYSEDGGANWQLMHDFEMPVYWVATDPNNPEVLYASVINHAAGFGGIWFTENLSAGENSQWEKIVNPTRTQGHPASIIVLNDGKVLTSWSARRNTAGQFTNSSGVFLYDPSTNDWEDLSHPNMVYWTKDVVVDPNDSDQNTWYAGVFSGWGGPPNDLGGLYKTTDRGQSWTRIWETHRVESCSFNPQNPDQLYVTTETEGLWFSNNINEPEPDFELVDSYNFMHPLRVFFNPFNQNEVWVASFGNGLKVGNTAALPPQQILNIKEGWSGVSSFIEPENPELISLFEPLGNDLEILYNQQGIYWPAANLNTLESWNSNTGYIIKTTTESTLTISGAEVTNPSIQIFEGWNLIPVLSGESLTVETVLGENIDNVELIKEIAGSNVYWPEMGVYSLQILEPGTAYFLLAGEDFILEFE